MKPLAQPMRCTSARFNALRHYDRVTPARTSPHARRRCRALRADLLSDFLLKGLCAERMALFVFDDLTNQSSLDLLADAGAGAYFGGEFAALMSLGPLLLFSDRSLVRLSMMLGFGFCDVAKQGRVGTAFARSVASGALVGQAE